MSDHFLAQFLALVFRAVVQQSYAARQVIEDQQRLRRNEGRIGHVRLLFRVDRELFEQAHHVITRYANEAARKRQVVVRARSRRKFERLAQRIEVLLLCRRTVVLVTPNGHGLAIHANLEGIAETEKGIAGKTFSAFYRFQQKAWLERLEFQIRRYRCIEIGRNIKRFLHVSSIKKARLAKNRDGLWCIRVS